MTGKLPLILPKTLPARMPRLAPSSTPGYLRPDRVAPGPDVSVRATPLAEAAPRGSYESVGLQLPAPARRLRGKPAQGQAGAAVCRGSGEGLGPGSPAELPSPSPPSARPAYLALRPHLPARKPAGSHLIPAAGALASGASVIGTGSRSGCAADLDPPTRGFGEGWPSRGPAAFCSSAALPPPASLEWSRLQELGCRWKPGFPPLGCRPRDFPGCPQPQGEPRPSLSAGRNRTDPLAGQWGCAGLRGRASPSFPGSQRPNSALGNPNPETTLPSRRPAFRPPSK